MGTVYCPLQNNDGPAEEFMDNNNRNNPNNGNKNDKKPKNMNTIIIILIAGVITFIAITMLNSMIKDATYKEITYSEFLQMIDEDKVSEEPVKPCLQRR